MEITIKRVKFDGTWIECSYIKSEVINDVEVVTEQKIKDYREPNEALFKLTKGEKMKDVIAAMLERETLDGIVPVEIAFSGKGEKRAATIKTKIFTPYGTAVVTLPKVKFMETASKVAVMLTAMYEPLIDEMKKYLEGESAELETIA